MPRVPLDEEHKVESPFEFPQLKLDKGERARIVVIEQEPLVQFIHDLRAPQIDENGRVVLETVKKFDNDVTQPKMDFISRPICLGQWDTLSSKGLDPDHCPACAVAAQSDAIQRPKQRFALHVIRYNTKPGSFDIQEPFSVRVVAWLFSGTVFNELIEIKKEWDDLRTHDLILGPCTVKQFQRFDIKPSKTAEWLASEERKKTVVQTYNEGRAADLELLIGRRLSREAMDDDISRVMQRVKQAHGGGEVPSPDINEVASQIDLGDLSGPSSDDVNLDVKSLIGEQEEEEPEKESPELDVSDVQPDSPEAESEEKGESSAVDFDELLGTSK